MAENGVRVRKLTRYFHFEVPMTDFWSLPYSLIVEKPDDEIFRLEDILKKHASSEWGWEFMGDKAMFRFKDKVDRVMATLLG